ncbi:hypothetical protein A2U01_0001216 [Trifolium medium]|uniref:Uncharacterized protein n=1 Tax=Trifolium medium TaxID=97028 RepID=A0A392M0D7_9FABA|nr:hypothetical protein [Trifolium medium]
MVRPVDSFFPLCGSPRFDALVLAVGERFLGVEHYGGMEMEDGHACCGMTLLEVETCVDDGFNFLVFVIAVFYDGLELVLVRLDGKEFRSPSFR